MWKKALAIIVLCVAAMPWCASAETNFYIESIHTTLHLPADFTAELIEDDDAIIIEISDAKNDAIGYYITYGYDETTKDYQNLNDMPRKLKQQLLGFYTNMISGREAAIEALFEGVPALMVNGLGPDNNYYALVVYYMNGFQMTAYAVKEVDFTENELANVLYFASEGLISIVNAMRFDEE